MCLLLFVASSAFAQESELIHVECKIYSAYEGVASIPFEIDLRKNEPGESTFGVFHVENKFENHFLTVTLLSAPKIKNPSSARFKEAIYNTDRIAMSVSVTENGVKPVDMLGPIPVWDRDVKNFSSSLMVPESSDSWELAVPAAKEGSSAHSSIYCSKKNQITKMGG